MEERLFALTILALFLLNYPLLALFDGGRYGIWPLQFGYLFGAWVGIIFLAYRITR